MGSPIEGRRAEFVENGFLVLNGFIDEDTCADARSVIWDNLSVSSDEPSSWVGRGHQGFGSDLGDTYDLEAVLGDTQPFTDVMDELFPLAEELVGEGCLAEPGAIFSDTVLHSEALGPVLNYPEPGASWAEDVNPHLDGFGPDRPEGSWSGFTIGLVVYFDRVTPGDGGFTVWPRSHLTMSEYFASNPIDSTGGGVPKSVDVEPPFEITGDAGTAVLWHNNLLHSSGPNRSSNIRMAGIGRLSHRDIEDIKDDAKARPWKGWSAME